MADIIIAPATPSGRSAVAVVRLSGTGAGALVLPFLQPARLPEPRQAALRWFCDGEGRRLDQLLLTWWRGPASYTGEDVVELSCHGNPVLVRMLCEVLGAAGARLAGPGEFSRRAVLNGRLSLDRAEAVRLLIEARSPVAARIAARNVGGALGVALTPLRARLLHLLAEFEVGIDHPEEEVDLRSLQRQAQEVGTVRAEIETLRRGFRSAQRLLRSPRVVLAGPVNAGKSTLFNALCGRERAITSPEAGTTRDLIEAPLWLAGSELTLIDTAGLRLVEEGVGAIEAEGQRRARAVVEEADLILSLWPWSEREEAPALPGDERFLRVWSRSAEGGEGTPIEGRLEARTWAVAALEGLGLEALREGLQEALGAVDGDEVLVTSLRQEEALGRADALLAELRPWIELGEEPVLCAELLHASLGALAEVIGETSREGVLDEVFSRFCIGK